MAEDQNIEWKESWRDEYLKWICGFANAQGGRIYIGKADDGRIVGIDNAKRLMDDLPNKIVTNLGIVCDINLLAIDNKHYIEIIVEPYPNPVNYRGKYHYRSGSTKQELKGSALDRFLLQRYGKTWDSVPVPQISIKHLDEKAFGVFRKKAQKSHRVDEDVLDDTNQSLLENLDLIEGDYINRAGILLFHPTPDKLFTGSYIKLGFFTTDDDLRFQDEVHGNVFEQIERTLELLKSKYLKARIKYDGISRVEEFPFPLPAIREAILNAVAHKDYSSTTPIQISVYENKMIIWNQGQLPENWSVDKLSIKHPSVPFNPLLSNTLFRSGYIEAWGRGTINMINECLKHKLPKPSYQQDFSGFIVEFRNDTIIDEGVNEGVNEGVSEGVSEDLNILVELIQREPGIKTGAISQNLDKSKSTIERRLGKLKELGVIEFRGAARTGGYYLLKDLHRRDFRVGEGVNKGVSEGENEGVHLVLAIIKEYPGIKSAAIAKKLDKGQSTIERYLKQLKENGLVEFVGAPKNGGYFLRRGV